jgi:hypothetical protein
MLTEHESKIALTLIDVAVKTLGVKIFELPDGDGDIASLVGKLNQTSEASDGNDYTSN